jgi:hypothetical protein
MTTSDNSSKQNPLVIMLFIMGIGFVLFTLFRLFGPKLPEPHVSQAIPTQTQEDIELQRQKFVSSQKEKEEIIPVLSGSFAPSETESGDIIVYKTDNDTFKLVLQNFTVSPAPDLHVIMLPLNEVPDNETIGMTDFVDVGPLMSTEGDQTFDIPPSFDPTVHKTVVIWCVSCEEAFATGVLE